MRWGGGWADGRVLVARARWLGPVRCVRARAGELVEVFDAVVRPVVEDVVVDGARREGVLAALRAAGVKLGFLAQEYALMAGRAPRLELAVLTGAITRVYDDLFDGVGGADLDRRVRDLAAGRLFQPANEVEGLFAGMYREIEGRLDRVRDAGVFAAFARLQEHQVRSWEQLDPGIADSAVDEVTRGKGGYGVLVLFGAAAGPLPPGEVRLVHDLGAVLQSLDDYQDVGLDRRAGVRTAATRGDLTMGQICLRLDELDARFRRHFPDHRAMFSVVCATLWMSFVRRRLPFLGAGWGVPSGPLATLLRRPAPLGGTSGGL